MGTLLPSMMCESTNELWKTNNLNTAHTYVLVLAILPVRDICIKDAHFKQVLIFCNTQLFIFYFQNAAVIPCPETLPARNLILDSHWCYLFQQLRSCCWRGYGNSTFFSFPVIATWQNKSRLKGLHIHHVMLFRLLFKCTGNRSHYWMTSSKNKIAKKYLPSFFQPNLYKYTLHLSVTSL